MCALAAGDQHRRKTVRQLPYGRADRRDLARNAGRRWRHGETEAAQQWRTAALEADTGLGLQDEIARRVFVEPLQVELDRRVGRRRYRSALTNDYALRQALA